MENSFTRNLNQGKDFSVDHFIIDYAIGCGLIDRDYSLGTYDLNLLLSSISEKMEGVTSLQEGMQLRKNREILKELFEVLPHTVIDDNEVKLPCPKYLDIYPTEVHEKIKPYASQATKAGKKPSKNAEEELVEDYYRYLYFQKEFEFKRDYLTNLSEQEKIELNETIKKHKIEQLKYDINEKEITYNRYSKMIAALNSWEPVGENIKFFLGIKENMIKMLNEGIKVTATQQDINGLKADLEKMVNDKSETRFVEQKIKNCERLIYCHTATLNNITSKLPQVPTSKKLK